VRLPAAPARAIQEEQGCRRASSRRAGLGRSSRSGRGGFRGRPRLPGLDGAPCASGNLRRRHAGDLGSNLGAASRGDTGPGSAGAAPRHLLSRSARAGELGASGKLANGYSIRPDRLGGSLRNGSRLPAGAGLTGLADAAGFSRSSACLGSSGGPDPGSSRNARVGGPGGRAGHSRGTFIGVGLAGPRPLESGPGPGLGGPGGPSRSSRVNLGRAHCRTQRATHARFHARLGGTRSRAGGAGHPCMGGTRKRDAASRRPRLGSTGGRVCGR
jgi:hypothetical protein